MSGTLCVGGPLDGMPVTDEGPSLTAANVYQGDDGLSAWDYIEYTKRTLTWPDHSVMDVYVVQGMDDDEAIARATDYTE